MERRFLIIAAHPDDEVLGCGATMARLAADGHEVYTLILGEGITSRDETRNRNQRKDDLKALKSNIQTANKILGCKEVFIFDLPDNRFDTVPLLDVVKIIEAVIDRLQPHTIYTHHGGDLNIDHQIVHRAVVTATRPQPSGVVSDLLTFEVPSSTEWALGQFQPIFKPNVFVDVSVTLEVKIKAMQQYESEARAFPHPRSSDALRTIARRWGSVVGLTAVEAFELVRSIR